MTKKTFNILKEKFIQKLIFFERTNDLLRKFYFPYRLYRYLNFEKHCHISFEFPSVLYVESTNACNLKCVFCPRIKSDKKIGFMQFKLFKKIVDECTNYNKFFELLLHKDGEPLLAPNLPKMIKYAKMKDISNKVAIASNGILLDEKKSTQILKSGLDELTISLDAATKETYERIKQVPAFELVENNIKRFVEMRNALGLTEPMVKVKIVYMKETQHEISDFIKKWKSIADSVPVRAYMTWAGSVENRNVNCVKPVKEPHPCIALFTGLAINWDGDVSVCCYDWNKELIVGDVNKETIYDIWHGQKLKTLRSRHLDGDFSGLQCKVCDFRTSFPRMNSFLRKKLIQKTLSI
jgi:radical SAM protein with 4Fe4S-binding SPASM domain